MDKDQKALTATIAGHIFAEMQKSRPNPQIGITNSEADRAVYFARRIVRRAFADGNQDDALIGMPTDNTPGPTGGQIDG